MGTQVGSGLASGQDSYEVGQAAAQQAVARMGSGDIKLTLVFASPTYDFTEVLRGIHRVTHAAPLIGCSSAGEFSDAGAASGAVAVTTIASDTLQVRLGVGRHFPQSLEESVRLALADFVGNTDASLYTGYPGRTIFLLADGLTGRLEELIEELMTQTGMQYQLFGGAAGDDGCFQKTFVFYNDEVLTDAFVCAEILSEQPFAIGLRHAWCPVSRPLRVTDSAGMQLHEINGRSAWEIYEEFAQLQNIPIAQENPSVFLMNHLLGVAYAPEQYKLRVPLWKQPDGSLVCAAEVPSGALARIMRAEDSSILQSARQAVKLAQERLGDMPIAGALMFECVATRLKLGARFADEIALMKEALGTLPFAGCNSYGQLARVHGEFSGLMDATALVCLIPA